MTNTTATTPNISSLFLPSCSSIKRSINNSCDYDSLLYKNSLRQGNLLPSLNSTSSSTVVAATTQSQLLPSVQSQFPGCYRVRVFLNELTSSTLKMVDILKNETFSTFSSRLAVIFGIPSSQQTIVALSSHFVQPYNMATMDPRIASLTPVNPDIAYIVMKQQSSPTSTPNSSTVSGTWTTHAPPKVKQPSSSSATNITKPKKPQPSEQYQKRVRERLTLALQSKSKKVNLHMISEKVKYSKASLSLWRRNIYHGNTLAIAKAVDETLDCYNCEKLALSKSEQEEKNITEEMKEEESEEIKSEKEEEEEKEEAENTKKEEIKGEEEEEKIMTTESDEKNKQSNFLV